MAWLHLGSVVPMWVCWWNGLTSIWVFDKLLEVNLEVSPFHWYACVGAAVLGCGYDIGFRCCCMVWVVL